MLAGRACSMFARSCKWGISFAGAGLFVWVGIQLSRRLALPSGHSDHAIFSADESPRRDTDSRQFVVGRCNSCSQTECDWFTKTDSTENNGAAVWKTDQIIAIVHFFTKPCAQKNQQDYSAKSNTCC